MLSSANPAQAFLSYASSSLCLPIELSPVLSKSLASCVFNGLAEDPFSEGDLSIIIEVGLGKCDTKRTRRQRDLSMLEDRNRQDVRASMFIFTGVTRFDLAWILVEAVGKAGSATTITVAAEDVARWDIYHKTCD